MPQQAPSHVPQSAQEIQDAVTAETIAAVQRFGAAFNRQDLDAVMAAMTEDCVLESSYPLPDGTRYEGQAAVRANFARVFRSSPHSVYEMEELFAAGARCVVRWVHRWIDPEGQSAHQRGVDILRVRNGKVAEKLYYVKQGVPTYGQR